MLTHLRVKNIALIDDISLDLDEGLNILTGETGAGKSIIMGAVNLALGARVSKDLLGNPERPAQVDLLFGTLGRRQYRSASVQAYHTEWPRGESDQ